MLEKDVALVLRDLDAGNYHSLPSDLRRIGLPIKQVWDAKLLQARDKSAEKPKFTSNLAFKQFLTDEIEEHKITELAHKDIPQLDQLKKPLSDLALFLMPRLIPLRFYLFLLYLWKNSTKR